MKNQYKSVVMALGVLSFGVAIEASVKRALQPVVKVAQGLAGQQRGVMTSNCEFVCTPEAQEVIQAIDNYNTEARKEIIIMEACKDNPVAFNLLNKQSLDRFKKMVDSLSVINVNAKASLKDGLAFNNLHVTNPMITATQAYQRFEILQKGNDILLGQSYYPNNKDNVACGIQLLRAIPVAELIKNLDKVK